MEAYIGQIQAFGFNFAPRGWSLCSGQILPIAQNTALFSLLGTTYGGNGQTTFALPDLRGRVPRGMGQGPGLSNVVQGEVAGVESTTVTTLQMPAHTHLATVPAHTHTATATATLYAAGVAGDKANPADRLMGSVPNMYITSVPATNVVMSPDAVKATVSNADATVAVTNAATGGSQPLSILNPYLGMNYSICLQGLFPPRN